MLKTTLTRVIVLLLCVLALFSCRTGPENKQYTIGFSQCTGGDAWRRQMLSAMKGELLFHPEINLQYRDARGDNTKQINDIRELVRNGIDLLIISPNEASPITPVVEEVFKMGIPVIVVDRKISSSFYTAYVGADNYEIGKLAGAYVSELLSGKGRIVEIWGLRGSTPAVERHKGFMHALAGFPDISIVRELDGEWEIDTVKHRLATAMTQAPAVDLVFAHNDVMAYGAYEVFKEGGADNNTKFIGIDGLPGPAAGIQLVDDKILSATFLYPTGGEEAIRTASRILRKEHFEKDNMLLSTVIDPKNVRVMKLQTDKISSQQADIARQQEKINEQVHAYTKQSVLIYILLASLVATIIGGSAAILAWREKNEINRQLEAKRNQILDQKNEIAEMAEKAELATQEKLKFFTNISHEFKTPLTLILGSIDEIIARNTAGKITSTDNLRLVRKNALRLLRLVNQLMDFRKIEDRKMLLRASEHDLAAFLEEVMAAFEKTAARRNIRYTLLGNTGRLNAWFDPDKLDKVIFNLLSNAFKFTHDNGKITLSLSVDESGKNAVIFVEDNGVGMSKDDADHAFDRFHTGEHSAGTGIGLSLSKEFMELHHGSLMLSSEQGKGTRFCIMLPLGKAHLADNEIASRDVAFVHDIDHEAIADDTLPSAELDTENDVAIKEHTILIVDDNQEMRFFIRKKLQPYYNIQEAQDGVSGLEKAFSTVPDLVICDIMLPGKNGIDVTTTLKNDLRTSHIPVVMLTARGSIEQKIEGVKTGADEYVTKPFVFEYLSERIKALIKNRKLLRDHYIHGLNVSTVAAAPGNLDRKFINDFTALIEKNVANAELGANEIAHELGMSRVQVYRKVKALLGFSINDYLVNVRLQKAKYLLLNTGKSVAEIAQEVGFSSPAYFSTIFKSKVKQSPTEFRSNKVSLHLEN
jgi:signal transduction histidine kinase/DNA-binding response OmpR family regulator/ABC-type xylose transport system substrate-binding protein